MAQIKIYPYNILAEGTTIVDGDPDTGYPEARLYDFSINFYWKDTVSGSVTFHVDQGALILPVDLLAIDTHNFSGLTMHWEYSDNDSDWTPAVTSWAQGSNSKIVKNLSTALTHRYWRVRIISATNPQCTEIYMSGSSVFNVTFESEPGKVDIDNVLWQEALGGFERSVKLGPDRKLEDYSLILNNTDALSFRTAVGYMSNYSRPFYFGDHESNYWLARFKSISREVHITDEVGLVSRDIEIIEMI